MPTENATQLLTDLRDSHKRGAFATACHGEMLKAAHELESEGLAEWKGRSYGSNFYAVTEKGLLDAHPSRS